MNFDLSDDQKMLVDTTASFVKKSSPVERFRKLRFGELGFDPKVWKQMGELGWLGVLFPEEVGGFGGNFLDAALIVEELAKNLVPEPYLSSVILAGRAVLLAGSEEQVQRYLAPLCQGDSTLALAYAEGDARYCLHSHATSARREGDSWQISGQKSWVLGGHCADTILVVARSSGEKLSKEGLTLFALPKDAPGLSLQSLKTMDGQRAAVLSLDNVQVDDSCRLGEVGQGYSVLENVVDGAAAAACAEAVGIAQRSLDLTVEYLKTREQFGKKIGSFQALQHRAVDMFVEVQGLRSLALEAAIRMDEADNAEERASSVSAAKVQLSTGGRFVTSEAIQLHGGIGVTDEHDIGLYFKRMRVLMQLFGDETYHLQRFSSLPNFS